STCAPSAPWWRRPAIAATARSRSSPPTIGGSAIPTRSCASASNAIRQWCDDLCDGLGALPSPLWGGVGGGGPSADHRTTPTPPPFAAFRRATLPTRGRAGPRLRLAPGEHVHWGGIKIAKRTRDSRGRRAWEGRR